MSKKRKVMIISPAIEDGGMRGLGKVTLALVDGLKNSGYESYLLTGAPLARVNKRSSSNAHKATVRRLLDHYLLEGFESKALCNSKPKLLKILLRDLFRVLVLGKAGEMPYERAILTQHQPDSLCQLKNLDVLVNFALIYKINRILPKRLTAMIVFSLANTLGVDTIITASPFPLKKPFIFHKDIKVIQYVHDIMPLNIMETVPKSSERFSKDITICLNNSDLIITSSLNAKDKLQSLDPSCNPEVVYLPIVKPILKNSADSTGLLAQHNIKKGQYILSLSTLEERKNIKRLIEAYSLIASQTSQKLVIVGGPGYGYEDIKKAYLSLNKKIADKIVFTSYISEPDKWVLLENCSNLVHPAIDEGLGIPVIEALLVKVPVVSTRLRSIEEIAPAGCVTFIEDPYDIHDIGSKIMLGINSKKNRRQSLESGSELLSDVFSNINFTKRLKKVISSL